MSAHRFHLFTIVTILFLSITTTISHIDSSGYETFTDKYGALINSFKLHTALEIWDIANSTCTREHAHLIIPNTESEVRVLEGFFKMLKGVDTRNELHVGYMNNGEEDGWRTVLGGPMAESSFEAWEELWMPGEPNNVDNNEFCVSMNMPMMKYLDVACNGTSNRRAFVCEKEIINQEAPEIDERIRV